MRPGQILIDMNVFPLGAESDASMNFALESLESIPLIKQIHPDLMTVCGIGNLTNGLAKKPYMRKVLTSVWLDEARRRGLDAAIINPNHYVFVEDLDPRDYELALRAILERDLDAFEELERISEEKKGILVQRRTSYDDLGLEEAMCQKVIDGFKERENGSVIVDGQVSGPLKAGDCVSVKRFGSDFLLVRNPRFPKWHSLVTKLRWGQPPTYS
ncbi:MAG: hypothetical protein IID39_04265 [Planctomycetes bacterium]|nr:hypothetical protein [Planctomycetota bacterium]